MINNKGLISIDKPFVFYDLHFRQLKSGLEGHDGIYMSEWKPHFSYLIADTGFGTIIP
jgi:hypothetical protein